MAKGSIFFFLLSSLSLMLNLLSFQVSAQSSITSTLTVAATSSVSLTPAMSSASVSSYFAALATSAPESTGGDPAAGDAASSDYIDSDAGAAGTESGSFSLSTGGLVAIIVVIVGVVVFGVITAVFWYLAKKRSWEVRAKIRRSARRVVTALTPRRSEFPKDVRRSSRGLTRIEEVPPTPKLKPSDLEKGNVKLSQFEMSEAPKPSKWKKTFKK